MIMFIRIVHEMRLLFVIGSHHLIQHLALAPAAHHVPGLLMLLLKVLLVLGFVPPRDGADPVAVVQAEESLGHFLHGLGFAVDWTHQNAGADGLGRCRGGFLRG